MVSFEVRQALKTTARNLMLTVVAVPYAAFSQLESSSAPAEAALREIAERIEEVQSQDGPHSAQLIGPLTALGLRYHESGNHDLAAAAIEQARLVVRVNHGLYSLEEAPLMRLLIQSQEARGNIEVAWNLEQKLLALVKRHPNDLRTVPILREIADKRMDLVRRYQAGEFPPQIVLGCYYNERAPDGARRCHAGSRGVVIRSIRFEASRYYAEAARVVRLHERWATLAASGCEKPSTPEIPEQRLSKREVRAVNGDVLRYLHEMTDYVGCVQTKYEGASTSNAPPDQLFALASQNNAAVAELKEVRAVYEERVGPITELVR